MDKQIESDLINFSKKYLGGGESPRGLLPIDLFSI
jgi:hypothetical protein